MKTERILCAANYYNDGLMRDSLPTNINQGFVVCGYRHSDCYTAFRRMYDVPMPTTVRQLEDSVIKGFLTNTNRFVNRKEAYKIAFEADQIIGPNKGCPTNEIGLTSEDLY